MLYWSLFLLFLVFFFDILILSKLGLRLFRTTIRFVSGILPAMFFLAESKFVHDLNFDFFLFEHLPPFWLLTSVFEHWTLTLAWFLIYSN